MLGGWLCILVLAESCRQREKPTTRGGSANEGLFFSGKTSLFLLKPAPSVVVQARRAFGAAATGAVSHAEGQQEEAHSSPPVEMPLPIVSHPRKNKRRGRFLRRRKISLAKRHAKRQLPSSCFERRRLTSGRDAKEYTTAAVSAEARWVPLLSPRIGVSAVFAWSYVASCVMETTIARDTAGPPPAADDGGRRQGRASRAQKSYDGQGQVTVRRGGEGPERTAISKFRHANGIIGYGG